jgi:demethylmenaquinone methyltransferase/2-methoxy-6-polyprenyl-1,4-benzoquinol methylase
MTAFVLRNVSDLTLFFSEAYRVLKPGANFVSLDMFPPSAGWFSALYAIYFHGAMPWIGGLLAGDRKAYQYLSDSVRHFHSPETVMKLIEAVGFRDVTIKKFLRGAVCMHRGTKPLSPKATI